MQNLIQSLWGTGFSLAQTPRPSTPSATSNISVPLATSVLSATSAPSAISAPSATHISTRDRDLISSDELLTDDALDELWAWFCGVAKDGTDLQLVFVKLINSARKPYMEHSDLTSTGSRSMIPATPRSGTSSIDIFRLWRHGSNTSTACDPPSERNVADHDPPSYGHHPNEPTNTQPQAHQALQTTITQLRQESAHLQTTITQPRQEGAQLQTTITQLRQENAQLQSKAQALETTVTQLRHENTQLQSKAQSLTRTTPTSVRVAIKSVHFGGRYVSMDASGFRSHHPASGGVVKAQTYIGGWEIFELVRHPNNLVSFKSTCFDNIFLRAEPRGLRPGQTPGLGGELVNCQYGCEGWEKFRILKVGENGKVAIEPAEFPGMYLRVDGNYMNLQGKVGAWEKFYLVVVP